MLGKVRISNNDEQGTTAVSNAFIDNFMAEANDAQIKVYLYLLRALQSGRPTTVSEIADLFNHTERDVKRALQYWEKKGLVRLEYDSKKRLSQICLEDITPSDGASCLPVSEGSSVSGTTVSAGKPSLPGPLTEDIPAVCTKDTPVRSGIKSHDQNLSLTLFAAETYFKRPLSSTETKTILYIYDTLDFPVDLLDYLLQYTAENAKGKFAPYLESTAIAWHEEGIRTLTDAKNRPAHFDKNIYEIMKCLGLPNAPTLFEANFFNKWLRQYAFPMTIIREACRRTVSNTQNHRVEYTDGILSKWQQAGVKDLKDIDSLDKAHEKQQPPRKAYGSRDTKPVTEGAGNKFNLYKQHDYDFEAIKNSKVSNH